MALLFVYCLRFSNSEDRERYMKMIETLMKWQSGYMSRVINEEQEYFVSQLKMPLSGIAINTALK